MTKIGFSFFFLMVLLLAFQPVGAQLGASSGNNSSSNQSSSSNNSSNNNSVGFGQANTSSAQSSSTSSSTSSQTNPTQSGSPASSGESNTTQAGPPSSSSSSTNTTQSGENQGQASSGKTIQFGTVQSGSTSEPSIQPGSLPQSGDFANSPLSVNSPANAYPDFMRYEPYNDGYTELDLWYLEARRFIRSKVVISPAKNQLAYTEVTYMPQSQQTFSQLFIADIPPAPPPPPPPDPKARKKKKKQPELFDMTPYENRVDPDHLISNRHRLYSVGMDRTTNYRFNTLTIVDWSADGGKILFKQKNGWIHTGLTVSDILVYGQSTGSVSVLEAIQDLIAGYWDKNGSLPPLKDTVWDINPIGWEAGSNTVFLVKATAFDKVQKRFLGVWKYDLSTQQIELVGLQDQPITTGRNGLLAIPNPPPPDSKKNKSKSRS